MITKDEFIERSNRIHNNKYNYSLVEYKNTHKKVKIICSDHGIFEQTPHAHLHHGCIKCRGRYGLNTEKFIAISNEIHNNKYNYSLVDYKNTRIKVSIICKLHDIFEQTPDNHLKGHGCPKCSNVNKSNTNEFTINSNKIHNNKYNYSLVDYINSKQKVSIICPTHGIFDKSPTNHLNGQGCPKCKGKNITKEDLIKKFNEIHNNKYDYSIVNYSNCNTPIKIICPIHGIFEQKTKNHLSGNGCNICGGSNKKTTNQFISESIKIHKNKYDYSLVNYKNAKYKVKIICMEHGIFKQMPYHHINGSGCPKCTNSKGENKINNILDENNINYIKQKTFDNCVHKKKLYFDFYLPDYNMCIEYDGEQHYMPIDKFGGKNALLSLKTRDKIKTDFCLDNDIKLLRIKYNENIEEKLKTINLI
jgi:very-short-patch-repair endonuclease